MIRKSLIVVQTSMFSWLIAPFTRNAAVNAPMSNGILFLVVLVLTASAQGWSQTEPPNPARAGVSREALQRTLEKYQQVENSKAYSDEMRRQARAEGELIRRRLAEGDFKVGDQIALVVEGEQQLTDTFAVRDGFILTLPGIGDISVTGVLRSELEQHLHQQLTRYIKQPVVRAESSIRVMMTGGIGRAGYYVLPTSALVADALMAAGGPVPNAKLDRIRVERKGEVIWEGEAMQQAIIEGRTLDRMSLQAGDHIVVPAPGRDASFFRTAATTLSGVGFVVAAILRLF